MELIKADWETLQWAEGVARHSPSMAEHLNRLEWNNFLANRLCFHLWERSGFNPENPSALRYTQKICFRIGDSKCVEDTNNRLRRMHTEDQSKDISTRTRRMYNMTTANVLSGRGISHVQATAALDSQARQVKLSHVFRCPASILPAEWSGIMGKRTWMSPTAEATSVAAAAWQWLLHFHHTNPDCGISGGWMSLMVKRLDVLRRVSDGAVVLSLGNSVWAFLFWPMKQVATLHGQAVYSLCLEQGSTSVVAFVTHLEQWEVLPCKVVSPLHLALGGLPPPLNFIAWVQEAGAHSLLSSAICKTAPLTVPHIKQLLTGLKIDYKSLGLKLKADLLEALIGHVFKQHSADERARLLKAYGEEKTQQQLDDELAQDPDVLEVWDEIDEAVRGDFKELGNAMDRQIVKTRLQAKKRPRAHHAAPEAEVPQELALKSLPNYLHPSLLNKPPCVVHELLMKHIASECFQIQRAASYQSTKT